ncbi:MAG: MraY family glycosyltransferase [Patescibacteria group bacterium]|jgi:UDP-GlcNAc:undecaprenyl-phosphate GlcNAc-1-phosphate transferase
MTYLFAGLSAFGLSIILTGAVRKFSLQRQILDTPAQAPKRKIHQTPIPLLGGWAIFLSFIIIAWIVALTTTQLFGGFFLPKYLIGMTIAGLVLMLGGYLDDRNHLKPKQQILFPIISALIIIAVGIGIPYITNPFGGVMELNKFSWTIFSINGIPYRLILFADIFAFLWLIATTYTTKILDGLDGLVSGITVIGAVIIAILSLSKEVTQPETAILASILAGSALGFLIWNWHPAKIFLGESGSTWTGFMLGTLAIIAGGKIATALLILGIPAIDILWAIGRRVVAHKSAFVSDRGHLHFRLLDVGFSHRQAVLLLYTITAVFGSVTLVTRGQQKFYALLSLAIVMFMLTLAVVIAYRRKTSKT